MYLTYEEYQNMGGTLDETAFNDVEFEAESIINYYTFNRLKNEEEQPNEVKMLMMYLIRNILTARNSMESSTSAGEVSDKTIASQSNDGVSVSYGGYLGNTSPQDLETVAKKLDTDILTTIKQYLSNERNQKGEVLLYRGVYK